MAERTGLEPATSGVTGQHSNQLNYRSTSILYQQRERHLDRHDRIQLAERTGLEPATSGVTGQHSNQLNYRSTFQNSYRGLALVGAEGIEPPTLSV